MEDGDVAALRLGHADECLECRAASDRRFGAHTAGVERAQSRELQHACCECERDRAQIIGACAAQHTDRLRDFEAVADGAAKRLLHIREERRRRKVRALSDGDHGLGECARLFERLHERAAADLYIEEYGVRA